MVYANCGDWIDSLTAMTEDLQGALSLVEYAAPALPAAAKPTAGKSGALAGGLA